MTITAEQLQLLINALNAIATALQTIAGAIGGITFVAVLFLLFKKMG